MCSAEAYVRFVPKADIALPIRFLGYSGKYVVGRQGPTDAFELKLANWLDVYCILNAIKTRGLIKICPGLASSQSRDATLDTVPMAA